MAFLNRASSSWEKLKFWMNKKRNKKYLNPSFINKLLELKSTKTSKRKNPPDGVGFNKQIQ